MTEVVEQINSASVVLVDKSDASIIRQSLTTAKLVDDKFVITEVDSMIAIPILDTDKVKKLTWYDDTKHEITELNSPPRNQKFTPAEQMTRNITLYLKQNFDSDIAGLIVNLPQKWEMFGDLAIIPNSAMNNSQWQVLIGSITQKQRREIWQIIAQTLKVKRLARQDKIATDMMRTSQVEMLLGDSGEVEINDFGVKFWLDVTKVMFSSGNVTERHRIGNIDMSGEVIVDAFAGIGYYTLPMLVRSNAQHVYACEINPNSIQALENGAKLNNVSERLTIFEGDNLSTMKQVYHLADRVHLGILPSSEKAWQSAINCLKSNGGMLHIHMNVEEEKIDDFVTYCIESIAKLAKQLGREGIVAAKHVEKVKWYAPRMRHIVIDVSVR
jgi:tRNA wybutosine-synthesizing protein 3